MKSITLMNKTRRRIARRRKSTIIITIMSIIKRLSKRPMLRNTQKMLPKTRSLKSSLETKRTRELLKAQVRAIKRLLARRRCQWIRESKPMLSQPCLDIKSSTKRISQETRKTRELLRALDKDTKNCTKRSSQSTREERLTLSLPCLDIKN